PSGARLGPASVVRSWPELSEGTGNVSIRRWISLMALAAVTATFLSSCSESLPLNQLPDITKLPQKVLGKDEQQGKVNEMINRGQTHQNEAAKEIENSKRSRLTPACAGRCPSNQQPTTVSHVIEEFHRVKRLPPYVFAEVNRLKAAARARGADIIDLGMGNPDMPTPQHIVDKLVETVTKPR